jgi:TonB-dependent SusC/RagA subfamily outer membrane receptor
MLFIVFAFNWQPADSNPYLNRVYQRFQKYINLHPQQKLYLHFDRDSYHAGEKVWFKAYLLGAKNLQPDDLSDNLYVEMLNHEGKRVDVKLLKLENGTAHGNFSLKDTLPDGNYQVRAFTNWMRNFDQDFMFRQALIIRNPNNKNYITTREIKNNKKFNRKLSKMREKIDLQFFPEGGNLVEGLESRVAFKASNMLGKGIKIKGTLYGKKTGKIKEFQSKHAGMGVFYLKPETGEKYHVVIEKPENISGKFRLPDVLEKGYVIEVDNEAKKTADVMIKTNIIASSSNNEMLLVVQSGGKIYYSEIINLLEDSRVTAIPKNLFPTGIAQVTLFNNRGLPECERLIFIDAKDQLHFNALPAKRTYNNREKVSLTIKTYSLSGSRVPANVSVSVIDESQVGNIEDYQKNIFSSILLSADLKGHIENPGYYFENRKRQTRENLDLLMLTHGWRRYAWRDIVKETYPAIQFPIEDNITIKGQITREMIKVPYNKAKVTLTILSAFNDVFTTTTGKKGYFIFEDLVYHDTIDVRIEAVKPNGKKNLLINIEEPDLPGIEPQKHLLVAHGILEKGDDWDYRLAHDVKKMEQQRDQEKAEEEERFSRYRLYNRPDNVIEMEDLPSGYSNLLQVLQGRVPGLQVTGNDVMIRGPSSLMLSNEPLVLLDGVPVDVGMLRTIPPDDVERIEILKGPSAAIFGSRGGNGVIAIYTKRGEFTRKGVITFQMLGYYSPKEFYSPVYEYTSNADSLDTRKTLFWDPEVKTGKNGEAEVNFYTSDVDTRLIIIVEGIGKQGKIGYDKTFITVE